MRSLLAPYFAQLHAELSYFYTPCVCSACVERQFVALSPEQEDAFTKVLTAGNNAFTRLQERGSYHPRDLFSVPEYKALTQATNQVLSASISQEIPQALSQYLEQDVFVFSELKSHAQLTEARSYLKAEDGGIVSKRVFEEQVLKLNRKYNRNYLDAEFHYAEVASQSAANWSNLSNETERYHLQYRTAGDDKVRDSHAAINRVTLPKTDPFWDSYYPPNGWRCRCTAVEVLVRESMASNSEQAEELGQRATTRLDKNGKNTLEMFRFNPGKDKRVFPQGHSYSKVVGAGGVSEKMKENFIKKDALTLNKNERYKQIKEIYKQRDSEQKFKQLTVDENASIYMYSLPDSYYNHLNKFNRTGNVSLGARADKFDKEQLTSMTNIINRGLDKVPTRFKGIAYRGTKLTKETLQPYKDAFENGTPHVEKVFMSTAANKNKTFSGNLRFIVYTKDAADIDKVAHLNEREVLFKAGQKFKVKAIKDIKDIGEVVVTLEQL